MTGRTLSERKASGAFYTPPYVVTHLVERTLGPLLRGLRPPARVRVLDPACGAGVFLLGAYRHLLDWHLDRYRGDPRRHRASLSLEPDGTFRLSASERERILLDSIHGVDLDASAVDTSRSALRAMGELPTDLGSNIRVGNALVDADGAGGFDWPSAFPVAMHKGGFDAVLGNPPFLNVKRAFLSPAEATYLEQHYLCAREQYDVFELFVERAVQLLVRPAGLLAFVLPRPVLTGENYERLRRLLLESALLEIDDCGRPFPDADVEAVALIVRRRQPRRPTALARLSPRGVEKLGSVDQQAFAALPFAAFSYQLGEGRLKLLRRMERGGRTLSRCLSTFSRGIEAGKKDPAIHRGPGKNRHELLRGQDVDRFRIRPPGLHFEATARNRSAWKDEALYRAPRLLVRRVSGEIKAALDDHGYWTLNTLYSAFPAPGMDPHYLLAILNSEAASFWLRMVFLSDDRIFPYLRISQLSLLPVPDPAAAPAAARRICDAVRALGDRGPGAGGLQAMNEDVCELYGVDLQQLVLP